MKTFIEVCAGCGGLSSGSSSYPRDESPMSYGASTMSSDAINRAVNAASMELTPATMENAVKNAVAAMVIDDLRPKINPNNIVAQPTYIIDSYALLQGAFPLTIQRAINPPVCIKNSSQ